MAKTSDPVLNNIYERLDSITSIVNNYQHNMSASICDIKSLLENEITELKTEFTNLKNQLNSYEKKLDTLERRDRALDITISGIPNFRNENVQEIFCQMSHTIGFNADVSTAAIFRIKANTKNKRNTPAPIIVKFKTQMHKSDFFDKYRNFGNLTLQSIKIDANTRIYCNDALTKTNLLIFTTARTMQKRQIIGKAYTKKDQVFIHEINCEDPILISNLAMLESFSKNKQSSLGVEVSKTDVLNSPHFTHEQLIGELQIQPVEPIGDSHNTQTQQIIQSPSNHNSATNNSDKNISQYFNSSSSSPSSPSFSSKINSYFETITEELISSNSKSQNSNQRDKDQGFKRLLRPRANNTQVKDSC